MNADKRPIFTRQNILFVLGVLIIVFEVIHAEVLNSPFHYEFLVLGASLCGVAITQIGDRK